MTFRTVDISALRPVPSVSRVRPDLRWIDISAIVIDERYQRPLARHNLSAIQKIADTFDWGQFTACLVAPLGDGTYALIDGQHRTHAAALVGMAQVPCLVNTMDLQAQSRAFAGVNGCRVGISAFHIYRAALTAGDKWAVAARDCVEAAGCRLMLSNSSAVAKRPGQVFCIGLVRRFVDRGHGAVLTLALRAIKASTSGQDIGLYQPPFLDPFVTMLIENRAYRALDLVAFLDDCSAATLERAVNKLRDLPEYGRRSQKSLMAEAMQLRLREWVRSKHQKAG